jgi:peroxiredoxin/Tfp pilus assembly protein PilF
VNCRILILVASFLCLVSNATPEESRCFRHLKIGQRMPQFSATKVLSGQLDSKLLSNQVTIVIFYSTKQRYSQDALKDLAKIIEPFKKHKLQVLAIATDSEKSKVASFIEKVNYPFEWLLDTDRTLFGLFGVIVTPVTALFDSSGICRYYEPEHSPDYEVSLDLEIKVLLGILSEEQRAKTLAQAGAPLLSEARSKAQRQAALAEDLLSRKQAVEAEASAREALLQDPDYAFARVLLGEALLQQENALQALDQFILAEKVIKPAYRARLGLGRSLSDLGKDLEALAVLEPLINEKVEKGRLYYQLALIYQRQGKTEKALETYRKSAEYLLAHQK